MEEGARVQVAVDEQVDRFVSAYPRQPEVAELPEPSGESRVVGNRDPQPEEAGQRPEEPLGLAGRPPWNPLPPSRIGSEELPIPKRR